ncbi:MAG: 50S ribosomal protein L13 [Candidatus Diapherotrites archaeon]
MTLIDGTGMILGRLSSNIAKRILGGERINLVNAEKIIISGNKNAAIAKYKVRFNIHGKGNPRKGPKFSRMPDRIVKYAVHGMLPNKSSREKIALKNLKVFIGMPEEFKEMKPEPVEGAKKDVDTFITIEELSKHFGVDW